MPISVYKAGGLSRSRINGVVSYPCIGCGWELRGTITTWYGVGSSVVITCGVGNEYNSREGVAVDAEGTVLSYKNAIGTFLSISFDDCWSGVFHPTTNFCGY
jgi:hypothetical protein